ncbi:MAG: hypothetical protein M9924_19280 [Rhizobiaceae bacterium]|nr:hypothetical protein [Rhizobiaceae bacterium]
MAKFLAAKIASAAAFLSTSVILSGCATPLFKPQLCDNKTERCLKVPPKKPATGYKTKASGVGDY